MALFENRYKKAARTELEWDLRELEKKAKEKATIKQERSVEQMTRSMQSNIQFARRCGLITEERAREYRERIRKAGTDNGQRVQEKFYVPENKPRANEGRMSTSEMEAQVARRRQELAQAEQSRAQANASRSKESENQEHERA